AATIAQALNSDLGFYGGVLGFVPAGALPPLAIDNLDADWVRGWLLIMSGMVCAVLWCAPVNAAISIEIEGVDEALRANVRAYLGIVAYRDLPNLSEITV